MRLLFDMNLSPLWVEAVKTHGRHSALHWSEIGALNALDTQIMDFARSEGCVVMTCDLDFGAILAATRAQSPSVVQIRADDVRPSAIADALLRALDQCEAELKAGALLTVEPERARVRLLPFADKP
jgi:predicted nuclease of predicted toxin-antitoxin system